MKLKIAVVCSSNQNRSMEAHKFLSKKGFDVKSFGSGNQVKLPGAAPNQPNVYSFDTTYEEMYKDLLRKDRQLNEWRSSTVRGIKLRKEAVERATDTWEKEGITYTQNGILHMLDRNRRIKARPERFQDCEESFDLVITAEERVYDQVIESLESHEPQTYTPVHIINIDIQDNHEEATLGAFIVCHLCEKICKAEDTESAIDEILESFETKYADRNILHSVAFY